MRKILFTLSFAASLVYGQIQEVPQPSQEELELRAWYHKNFAKENVYGVATEDAYAYAEEKGLKINPVVVGVIDSGIQGDHEDLAKNMWVNVNEIPNNGIDDDNNGYIDDVHGWNFIGGADGRNVNQDNLELTRLVREGNALFASKDNFTNETNQKKFPEKYATYLKAKAELDENYTQAKMAYEGISIQAEQAGLGYSKFGEEYGMDKEISVKGIKSFKPKSDEAKFIAGRFESTINTYEAPEVFGKTPREILEEFNEGVNEAISYYESQVKYHYNLDFDPRDIVGDDYENLDERIYGNNDIQGPDALHGTHVAGIIGAVRNNNIGMNGIATNAKLMSIRAVPDGDERDKDIANAIRYAVDNGAKIINMSFGKAYSPHPEKVWEAMRYASDNNVLLVHAAGNDNQNIDEIINYPINYYSDGKVVAPTWITVGASTRYNDDIRASFSNFGKKQVDIFAPGLEIYSTIPQNDYKFLQGTSMAAPVVSGVAALVWGYFPELTAQELREVLIKSGNLSNELLDLSTNGVIVDAKKALQIAEMLLADKK